MNLPLTSDAPAGALSAAAVNLSQPQDVAPRLDALPPGTRLEEYEIEHVIGSSSFGLVYLANDEAFERHVAIKEYLPDTLAVRTEQSTQVMLRAASHADAFERGRRAFLEEAQLLARCQHPSLLHVLRSWEANGTVYRAMPFYAGKSLQSLRQAMHEPPDEASLRALIDGLLDALQTLHDAGALHREITPQRILLLPDDRPVLLDAGAARRAIVGDQARALMTLLSPSFAAPEQRAPSPERPQGPWTDLYALAAVVQFCISGELPPAASLFGGPSSEPMDRLVKRLRTTHASVHYSASFRCAIDAALAPLAQDRPQNVEALRQMLDNHPPALAERIEPVDAFVPTLQDEFEQELDTPFDRREEPTRAAPELIAAAEDSPVPESPTLPPMPMPMPIPTPPLPPQATVSAPSPAPAEPIFNIPRPAPLDARPSPVFSFAQTARRRRRRLAWSGATLALAAAGVVVWTLDQQRLAGDAQSAFARAARHDRLTANVPSVPALAETTTASTMPTPSIESRLPEMPTAAVAARVDTQQAPATASSSGTETAPPTQLAKLEPADTSPAELSTPSVRSPAAPAKKPAVRRASGTLRGAASLASRSSGAATAAVTAERTAPRLTSPREACGSRTQFSLYRCMQTQCAQAQWLHHPLCKRLRARDDID